MQLGFSDCIKNLRFCLTPKGRNPTEKNVKNYTSTPHICCFIVSSRQNLWSYIEGAAYSPIEFLPCIKRRRIRYKAKKLLIIHAQTNGMMLQNKKTIFIWHGWDRTSFYQKTHQSRIYNYPNVKLFKQMLQRGFCSYKPAFKYQIKCFNAYLV